MYENEILAELRDNDGDDKQHQDGYDCDSNHPVGSHPTCHTPQSFDTSVQKPFTIVQSVMSIHNLFPLSPEIS